MAAEALQLLWIAVTATVGVALILYVVSHALAAAIAWLANWIAWRE